MTSPLFFDDTRADIALERDRQYENRPTHTDFALSRANAMDSASDWGDEENGTDWIEIAEKMLVEGKGRVSFAKSVVFRTTDTWDEAVTEAAIRLGLGSDDLSPYIHLHDWNVDLYI